MNSEGIKEQLLESAERYAKTMLSHCTPGLPGLMAENYGIVYDQEFDRLYVHFLFPNLDERERTLLATLSRCRREVKLGAASRRDHPNPEAHLDHEKILVECEADFVSLRDSVKQLRIEARLSPVQRDLLQDAFLSVPLLAI